MVLGRVVSAILAFGMLAPLGCDSTNGQAASGGTVSSEVLREEFNRVFTEMTAKADPNPSRAKLAGNRILTELTTQTPGMFEVSSSDAARFRRNEFDDAANRIRIAEAEKNLKSKGGPPQFTRYLMEQDRVRPLSGVRLELLAHLAGRNAKFLAGGAQPGKK